jgi:hypothetical protein
MDDCVRPELLQQVYYSLAVANVEFVVNETWDRALKAVLIPARVSLWTEKHGPLIVVNSVNSPTFRSKKVTNLGPNKA